MTPLRSPVPRLGAAALALLAACAAPRRAQPSPAGGLAPREAMARYYPDVLAKGMRGDEYVYFEVDAGGRVAAHGIGRYGDPVSSVVAALGRGPGETVERRRTRPGELGPDAFDLVWVRETASRRSEAPPPGSRRPQMMLGSYGKSTASDADPGLFARVERLARESLPEVVRSGAADGWVSLRFTVGADGVAKEVVLVDDVHPEVAAAARRVVEETRFVPEVRDGRPVEVVEILGLDFNALLRPKP